MEENKEPKRMTLVAENNGLKYEFVFPEGVGSFDLKQVLMGMRDHIVLEERKRIEEQVALAELSEDNKENEEL